MTGFGTARAETEAWAATVELKSVNNRYLKVSTRLPEVLNPKEGDVERIIKEFVARGSVQLQIRLEPTDCKTPYRVNADLVKDYWTQAEAIRLDLGKSAPIPISSLFQLPGTLVDVSKATASIEEVWPLVERALRSAGEKLLEFRHYEGAAMDAELRKYAKVIAEQVDAVEKQAPAVISTYREKMLDRIRTALSESDATVTEENLIRETAIHADRCDVTEEIARMRSHLTQFEQFLDDSESQGRKLDFLIQEMNREINTIGSKANDASIAHLVVELKGAVEKLREILQNVE
ncbi:Conserved hypothetical protein CHP00255 [Stratiformator vulcanicus]|uniref:YicC-like family, N-terminal region n=2 Tax=Stratiformator vulcanicus TaxID=2527980 RepID=A0A517R6G2_9PLAN|nr:Conserved hypothetical protein CHP00255 [Stratiformator vulcanicus]